MVSASKCDKIVPVRGGKMCESMPSLPVIFVCLFLLESAWQELQECTGSSVQMVQSNQAASLGCTLIYNPAPSF